METRSDGHRGTPRAAIGCLTLDAPRRAGLPATMYLTISRSSA